MFSIERLLSTERCPLTRDDAPTTPEVERESKKGVVFDAFAESDKDSVELSSDGKFIHFCVVS